MVATMMMEMAVRSVASTGERGERMRKDYYLGELFWLVAGQKYRVGWSFPQGTAGPAPTFRASLFTLFSCREDLRVRPWL